MGRIRQIFADLLGISLKIRFYPLNPPDPRSNLPKGPQRARDNFSPISKDGFGVKAEF
jgi:hypothetical protein